MSTVQIAIGPFVLHGRLEEQRAPVTCEAFRQLLPLQSELIHVRWSGEACWVPMGDFDAGLDFENHTSHPAPGQMLWYPGGYSETELLLPYGGCRFASVVGQLAGNHFLTVERGMEQLPEIGKTTLWKGAQPIEIAFVDES
jgi:hypothetical protein